ncbi:MAG: alpha/beta fold hydrolase, partial [Actinomycetota bacterium]
MLLLHGLLSSNATFGAAYDRLGGSATVVAPDLLGFGASLDEALETPGIDDHLDAIDAALDHLDLGDRPVLAAGHSLGSLLALHWGARHPERCKEVVAWCPPLFVDDAEAFGGIGHLGPFVKVLSRDTAVARVTAVGSPGE